MELEFTNKYVIGIIAVVVGILVCTMGMIPAIADASTETYSNDNPSWIKLSEYEGFDDIPWSNLVISFSNGYATVVQDGHSVSGVVSDMLLFGGTGEGCQSAVYIKNGELYSYKQVEVSGQTSVTISSGIPSSVSFTKNETYLSCSVTDGNGFSLLFLFDDSRNTHSIPRPTYTYTYFIVPDYEGELTSFTHDNLWTNMESVFAIGSFAGVTSINDYTTYPAYDHIAYYNADKYFKKHTPLSMEFSYELSDDKLESVMWSGISTGASGTSTVNPSTQYMSDPVIPTIPISYVTPEQTDGVWGVNVLSTTNRTVALVSYSGAGGSIQIPASVNLSGLDYSVIQVGAGEGHPLFNNSNIGANSTITFEQDSHFLGISTISASAFQGCTNLTGTIAIPDHPNGITIGSYAFMGAGFSGIDLGTGTPTLNSYCFANCPNLTYVSNTSFVTSVGCCMNDTRLVAYESASYIPPSAMAVLTNNTDDYAFYGCTALEILSPSGTVGKMAFKGCTGVTVMALDLCTSIGYEAFANCVNVALESSNNGQFVLDHATFIDTGAFSSVGEDNDLGGLVLGSNLTAICNNAFAGSGIRAVNIPGSCKVIGNLAFNSSSLMYVTLGEGITDIGYNAFGSTDLAGTLVLPQSLVTVGDACFSYTDIENVVDKSNATIGSTSFINTNVKEVLSINDRTYTCFGVSTDIENSYSASICVAPPSITVNLKGSLYTMLAVMPLVFMAGMMGFAWWFISRKTE